MANNNIGAQAASAVDEKIREFRTLQEELTTLQNDLGTLMAQRNENEMVKQVCMVHYFVAIRLLVNPVYLRDVFFIIFRRLPRAIWAWPTRMLI